MFLKSILIYFIQLGLSYPGSSVFVSSQTLTPPTINIDPNTLEGYFYGNMTYRAITPAGNDVFLFKTLAVCVTLFCNLKGCFLIINIDSLCDFIL